MFKNLLLIMLSCSFISSAAGQTKEESIKWILSKLNKYGHRPVELVNEGITITPLEEWTYNKGALHLTCKKVDKELNTVKYVYSIPFYAIDSVGYNDDGPTRPAQYLQLYLSCSCASYTYHDIVSGGNMINNNSGKVKRMDAFMLGNEEKDLKERMNKAFAYLRLYFPKPKETF